MKKLKLIVILIFAAIVFAMVAQFWMNAYFFKAPHLWCNGHKGLCDFLYEWQQLLGSVIGAATPILILVFEARLKKYREKRDWFLKIDKMLVNAIYKTIETREAINRLIEIKIAQIYSNIDGDTNIGRYSMGKAFFPLLETAPLSNEVLNFSTDSNYVDNLIVDVYGKSADFELMIADSRRQFEETLESNMAIATLNIQNGNDPRVHNQNFKENVERYEKSLRNEMLDLNIPHYLKILAKTRVAIRLIDKIGVLGWRLRFDPRYTFFLTQKRIDKYLQDQDVFSRIDEILEPDVQVELARYIAK